MIHCEKKHQHWYVHVSKWRGMDGCYLLFRGDSDPMIMCEGLLYDYYDLENRLEDEYEYDRETWESDCEDGEPYPYENMDAWMECFDFSPADLFGQWGNCKTAARKSTKTIKKMRQHLSAEEKRVMHLASILPDLSKQAGAYKTNVVDEQWDAHHNNFLTFSQTIRDYQVLRVFDVEIENVDPIDFYATDEERQKIGQEAEEQGYFDNSFEEIMDRICDEHGDPYHDYEYAEVVQYWLNVNTGNIIMLGKVYNDDPQYCCFDGEWEIIRHTTKRAVEFRKSFFGNFGECHYKDLTIHPKLVQRGYRGLDAMNWSYGCGEEENKNNGARFLERVRKEGGLLWFLQTLVTEGNEWERRFKTYGFANVIESFADTRIGTDNYLAAMKVVMKNHYQIDNMQMWRDLLVGLVELKKDIRNAYYVCPADLKADHDKWLALINKKREKARRQREERERIERELAEARKLEEAQKCAEEYMERIARYKDINIEDSKYRIFVCPTIKDMAEEGAAMGHCVFSMEYYKKKGSLVLFCRDKETDHRETTIELNIADWTILQCYAKGNNYHKDNDAIRALLMDNIRQFKDAKKKRKCKVVEMKPRLHQENQETLAIAA